MVPHVEGYFSHAEPLNILLEEMTIADGHLMWRFLLPKIQVSWSSRGNPFAAVLRRNGARKYKRELFE